MDLLWTKHSREKMQFYRLSEQRIKRVLKNPNRVEEGIAPKTIALMQSAGSKKHPYEIWTMYQKTKTQKLKIISCWRYPGKSPIGVKLPIPDELKGQLESILNKIKENEKNY